MDQLQNILNGYSVLLLCYLIGSVTFIVGLKMLSHPDSARKGNLVAAAGMTIAIFGTIFLYRNGMGERLHNYGWIFAGLVIGTIVGTMAAKKVQMTAMPEMVSLFNGMGGACAMLISVIEFRHMVHVTDIFGIAAEGADEFNYRVEIGKLVIIVLGMIIGSVSFSGSIIAWGKLNGRIKDSTLKAQQVVNIGLLGGILVGSAGTILTMLMCKAMNRSLTNVLIGSFGGGAAAGGGGGSKDQGNYKEISLNDTAVLMAYASKVMIIPGYGLAVAQAQHACHELEKLLEEKGVEVTYGIHPVAGRMPGHMNVLLAEADVPYDKLMEMEDANSQMSTTGVVMILGANDVVNPAAKDDPSSPIYGMPILEVEKAEHVIVNKRSMKPGYAGIENELFFRPKTSMLFGDAKKVLQELVSEMKQV